MNAIQPYWQKTRIGLLAFVLLGTLGILTYQVLSPVDYEEKEKTTATVPKQVPLSNWQFIDSEPVDLIETSRLGPGLTSGRKYEYSKNQKPLEIEVRYEKYRGALTQFLTIYRDLPSATITPKIHYQENIGHYAFFDHENQTYLGSCITPQGETTVTHSQYNQNRSLKGWGIGRTFLWVIGQKDLFEPRCLWTLMSLPKGTSELDFTINIDPNNIELNEVEETLEEAWFEWYAWWKENFPDY
ncbi:MAG: cyanoexosortase A system-associated protein [Crocosphaera sp.]